LLHAGTALAIYGNIQTALAYLAKAALPGRRVAESVLVGARDFGFLTDCGNAMDAGNCLHASPLSRLDLTLRVSLPMQR
jgi:hypothetical protein